MTSLKTKNEDQRPEQIRAERKDEEHRAFASGVAMAFLVAGVGLGISGIHDTLKGNNTLEGYASAETRACLNGNKEACNPVLLKDDFSAVAGIGKSIAGLNIGLLSAVLFTALGIVSVVEHLQNRKKSVEKPPSSRP